METICVVISVLLYWAVILSGAATLTAGLFKAIDIIERPARKHRGKGDIYVVQCDRSVCCTRF